MGFFSSTPQTTTGSYSSTSQTTPDPTMTAAERQLTGTGSGLANYLVNNYYPGALYADVQPLAQQYWGQAGSQLGSNLSDIASKMQNLEAPAAFNLQSDPNAIQMPMFNQGSFTPDQGTLSGIASLGQNLFSRTPQVQAAPGVSGLASSYQVNPLQVQAPGGVGMIGGLNQVQAPNLNYFQMGPAQQTSTQSFTSPGTAQQFMSPYEQNVINSQLALAQTQEQQQLAANNATAAQAGAYGGSRAAVENANTELGYQQLAANIGAQGYQNAFQNAQQQFNTQQQLGLQSQVANQQAGLTVGGQNLAANLQTQGLGAQLNMQGQLANQQVGLQSALANQQAQEFGSTQKMQAQLANQQAGVQTGLAAQQMGLQGGMFDAQQSNQMALANQAAAMQGLGMQYQGGLQGALQQQQLGMQGQIAGGQLGLQSALGQAGAQNALRQTDLSAINQAAGLQNLGTQTQLQGLGALGTAANSQQGYAQSVADAKLAGWLQQTELPMQGLGWLQALYSGAQGYMPYSTATQGNYQSTVTPAQMGIFGQLLGGAFGALNSIGNLGIFGAKGGLATKGLEKKPIERTGLARYRSKGTHPEYRQREGGLGRFRKVA